jgi:hypothetical protein
VGMATIHGYADDSAILIHGKFPNTVSELLQEAMSMVQQWSIYQSTKDGNSTIHPEERLKGPKGNNPLWTHFAADC